MLCCSLEKRTWHQLARRDRGAKISMHRSVLRNPGTVPTAQETGAGKEGQGEMIEHVFLVQLLQQKWVRDLFLLIVIVGVTC
jgi:hypothetical protein